jgi:hypothetical protein
MGVWLFEAPGFEFLANQFQDTFGPGGPYSAGQKNMLEKHRPNTVFPALPLWL